MVFIAVNTRRIKLSGPNPCGVEDLPATREPVIIWLKAIGELTHLLFRHPRPIGCFDSGTKEAMATNSRENVTVHVKTPDLYAGSIGRHNEPGVLGICVLNP